MQNAISAALRIADSSAMMSHFRTYWESAGTEPRVPTVADALAARISLRHGGCDVHANTIGCLGEPLPSPNELRMHVRAVLDELGVWETDDFKETAKDRKNAMADIQDLKSSERKD